MGRVPIFWDHNGPQGKSGPGDLLVVYLDFATKKGLLEPAHNQHVQHVAIGYANEDPRYTYGMLSNAMTDAYGIHITGLTEKELTRISKEIMRGARESGVIHHQAHADRIFERLTEDLVAIAVTSTPHPIITAYNDLYKRYREVHGSPIEYDGKKKAKGVRKLVGQAKAEVIGKILSNGKFEKKGSRAVGDTVLDWDGMSQAETAIYIYPDREAYNFAKANGVEVWPDPEDISSKESVRDGEEAA